MIRFEGMRMLIFNGTRELECRHPVSPPKIGTAFLSSGVSHRVAWSSGRISKSHVRRERAQREDAPLPPPGHLSHPTCSSVSPYPTSL